jgi:hypothetical protein
MNLGVIDRNNVPSRVNGMRRRLSQDSNGSIVFETADHRAPAQNKVPLLCS